MFVCQDEDRAAHSSLLVECDVHLYTVYQEANRACLGIERVLGDVEITKRFEVAHVLLVELHDVSTIVFVSFPDEESHMFGG